MQNYKFLLIALFLAITMGSTLPIYNALVSYPTMVKLMQENAELSAVNSAQHIVEDFFPLKIGSFNKELSPEQQDSIQQLKKITVWSVSRSSPHRGGSSFLLNRRISGR